MAALCRSVSLKRARSCSPASSVFAAARMIAMTASMLSTQIFSPSRMCSRSSALPRSNRVRRVMTLWRWSTKRCSSSLRFITFGTPSASASMMAPKVVCIGVCLNRLFSTTSGTASRFSSITTRIPSRSDSSRRSPIPSIFFSRTSSAMSSTRRALLTM